MRVSQIEVLPGSDYCELRARVERGTSRSEPFSIWYRFPPEYERSLSPENGDPFLAALLAPAMAAGESLVLPVPVSPQLLHSAAAIQVIYRSWEPTLTEIDVQAPTRTIGPSPGAPAARPAMFFSAGVDSFYTLLKNLKDHPDDEESIERLIVVKGFDIRIESRKSELFPVVEERVRRVAQELGISHVAAMTNVKEFARPLVSWGRIYHGAAMASTVLALGSALSKIHIAASYSHEDLFPWGTHPSLDPLWSTETLSFVHDGCEARRLEKIRFIAGSPVAMKTLRVCYQNPDNQYNCGRCEKCLRTMIGLHLAGALERCQTLPDSIDLERVREIRATREPQQRFIAELLGALGSSPADQAIQSALRECLSRSGEPRWKWRARTGMARVRRFLGAGQRRSLP